MMKKRTPYKRKTRDLPVVRVVKLDWRRIAMELRRHGWQLKKIGDMLGIKDYRLERICKGHVEPKHSEGIALLRLHNIMQSDIIKKDCDANP